MRHVARDTHVPIAPEDHALHDRAASWHAATNDALAGKSGGSHPTRSNQRILLWLLGDRRRSCWCTHRRARPTADWLVFPVLAVPTCGWHLLALLCLLSSAHHLCIGGWLTIQVVLDEAERPSALPDRCI